MKRRKFSSKAGRAPTCKLSSLQFLLGLLRLALPPQENWPWVSEAGKGNPLQSEQIEYSCGDHMTTITPVVCMRLYQWRLFRDCCVILPTCTAWQKSKINLVNGDVGDVTWIIYSYSLQGGFPPWLLKNYTAEYSPRFRTLSNSGESMIWRPISHRYLSFFSLKRDQSNKSPYGLTYIYLSFSFETLIEHQDNTP